MTDKRENGILLVFYNSQNVAFLASRKQFMFVCVCVHAVVRVHVYGELGLKSKSIEIHCDSSENY